jgi:transcriptional regulator with XRE-family HTH domain
MGMARYNELLRRTEQSLAYWVAGAEIAFTEDLARAMEEKGVSRAELARRIGSSQAYITKVLRGNVNFTMATMVKLARALDMELKLNLAPRDAEASSQVGPWKHWEHGAAIYPRTETLAARIRSTLQERGPLRLAELERVLEVPISNLRRAAVELRREGAIELTGRGAGARYRATVRHASHRVAENR